MIMKYRCNFVPIELTLATSKGRDSERLDPPFLVMRCQILKTINNVPQPRSRSPMILGREIQDPRRHKPFEKVRTPRFNFASFTAGHVIFIHIGKAVFELKRYPLAHHSNAIYRVYPSLGIGPK
jgi:hypothetical protein